MKIIAAKRQTGKTTMLIEESARTGATIAVATHQMADNVQYMAAQMGLKIPEPVTYAKIFRNYDCNKTTRYLVDELQLMLGQLNVETATLDEKSLYEKDKLNDITNVLMNSDAVTCAVSDYKPRLYASNALYEIPQAGYRVEVDYDKLAKAIYDAGYRKEK